MSEETSTSVDRAPRTSAEKWKNELTTAEKDLRKFWERGRRVVKRYMDEMDTAATGISQAVNVDKYNVFWSNVGVLKASLYANPPKPVVKREFDDQNDDVGRVAAIMMERLLTQPFENPESDMNVAFFNTVEDRLIPGLGQIWLRYVPEIEETEVEQAVTDKKGRVVREAIKMEEIVDEAVATDYVYWEDFWWSPCRTWKECRWVARRVWLDKKEFAAKFDPSLVPLVNWTKKTPDKYGERVTPESMGVMKTEVFEIWDKTTRTVNFVSRSCEYLLDQKGDPLEIEGFFPCPKPLLATTTTSSTIPKADYLMVQSQYRRLDNLTMRIGMLESAIQASGVYDKANKELSQILSGNMNKMIPVDNWAMFAEKGGLKGVVDWFPLEMIVNALDKLRELKTEAKAELYELTGISDIMRGVTEARETATAQGLKAQYSSVRLQYLQGEVAYFIQEGLRIKAGIIAKHFQPQTIIRKSLIELTPDAELAQPAVELMKEVWEECYRVKVYADTLAIPDYNAERQGRIEFITATGQFISQITPLIQMEPGSAPFLTEILKWGIASFRSAQSIEGVFDKAMAAMIQKLQNPPPPQPDPAMIKANAEIQADAQKTQAEIQQDQAKAQAQIQNENAKTAAQIQRDNMKAQAHVTTMVSKAAAAVAAANQKARLAKSNKRSVK